MSNAPLDRHQQMRANVAREEAKDRRTIARVQMSAALVLLVSTLFAWENHPRVEYHGGATPGYYVREVGHTVGALTTPAGQLVIALALMVLSFAHRLRGVRLSLGWCALGVALAALGVTSVEIVQLMLGRRNWLDHLSRSVTSSALGGGVGIGVWIAAAASIVLVASAMTYVWLGHRLWRKNPALSD